MASVITSPQPHVIVTHMPESFGVEFKIFCLIIKNEHEVHYFTEMFTLLAENFRVL